MLSETEDRLLALHPEAVDLVEIVGRAVDAAVPRARGLGVTLAGAPADVPPIEAVIDPDRVAQIVGNLLDNALRHTPAGGTVTTSVVSMAAGRLDQGDVAIVRVRDTGDGIHPRDLPRVFDRLYRADASRRHDAGDGSGLGLTISRALARAMGGDLEVHSRGPGEGACATLTLPARPPRTARHHSGV
jgi:signal transduction histidine kinase